MEDWITPPRPAELVESRLTDAILSGTFPINSNLPAERELAGLLGVTRPTLREALQRLSRDGWVEIRQGKPTRVKDYMQEGNLAILNALSARPAFASGEFVEDLLRVRVLLAPSYFTEACRKAPEMITSLTQTMLALPDPPQAYTAADSELHKSACHASQNTVLTLMMNSFVDLYRRFGKLYFEAAANRLHSKQFYTDLHAFAQTGQLEQVTDLTRRVMRESLENWKKLDHAKEEE